MRVVFVRRSKDHEGYCRVVFGKIEKLLGAFLCCFCKKLNGFRGLFVLFLEEVKSKWGDLFALFYQEIKRISWPLLCCFWKKLKEWLGFFLRCLWHFPVSLEEVKRISRVSSRLSLVDVIWMSRALFAWFLQESKRISGAFSVLFSEKAKRISGPFLSCFGKRIKESKFLEEVIRIFRVFCVVFRKN